MRFSNLIFQLPLPFLTIVLRTASALYGADEINIDCPDENYCRNGAQCIYLPEIESMSCRCKEDFWGEHCERPKKVPEEGFVCDLYPTDTHLSNWDIPCTQYEKTHCGDFLVTQKRECFYTEQEDQIGNNCVVKSSTDPANNPCGESIFERLHTCKLKPCEVQLVMHKTKSDDKWASSISGFSFRGETNSGQICEIGLLKGKGKDGLRGEGAWDSYPLKVECDQNVLMRKNEIFPKIHIQANLKNNDGWIFDRMAVMINGNVALYGATKVYGDVTVSALTGTNIAIAEWNKKAIEGMGQKN